MPYPLAPGSARREHARAKSRANFSEAKRTSAVSFTAIAALAAGAVFAAPAAAAPVEPVEVLRLDFQDGTTSFGGDGGYFTNVVDPLDPEGDNLVLQSDVTADWNGLQIPGSFFTPGGTYRVEAQVLDGDTGGSSRFVGQTDENAHAWIGDTPINDEAWTAVTGEFVARATGVDFVRLVAGNAGTFFADDVVVTRVAEAPAAGTPDEPAEGVVVFERDFEDGEIAGGDGGAFEVVADPMREGNLVQRAETGDTWHGLQIPASVFQAGATYLFEAEVLAPAGVEGMNARFEGADNPWPWVVGNQPIADSEWRTISGEFQWNDPEDPRDINPMRVRLVNGGAGAFYQDNVRVTRIAAPAVDEEPAGPTVVRTWDFETNADLASLVGVGGAEFARVADEAAANGYALRVTTGDEDWRTARITLPTSMLGEYRLDVTIRLADVAAGELQARAYPGFTYMQNQAISDVYTTVSTGVLATLGEQVVALHVQPAGADFYIDQIDLVQVVAPPAVDEDFVFERLEWDFEDGTSQGWFGRTAADGFGVVEPGADSAYAIGVWDRTDQGSGPMLEIDELVRPGQRLEFSADVRFTEPVSDNRLTLSIQNGPSSFTNLVTNMVVDADGEWTRIEGIFVVPAFTTMARLYLESPWAQGAQGETAAFKVDNIVIDVPAPLDWDRNLVPFQETLPGIHAGVAVDSRDLIDEMGEVIEHHFSHLVAENHMKPDSWWTVGTGAGTNWADGMDSFRIHPEARTMLDFAVEHDMTVFGHVLIWHSQVPAWFFSYDNSTAEMAATVANQEEMVRRIWEYTRIVAGGLAAEYGPFGTEGNPVNSFEVANEVVHGGGVGAAASHNLRPNSPWTRIFAPVEGSYWTAERGNQNRDWFLYEAFQAAEHYFNYVFHVGDARGRLNERDDRITLWINDYNTERGLVSPNNPMTKRHQLLQVTNRLLEAGAPLDGVGHQFHAGLIHPVEGLRFALDLFAYENGYVAKPVLQAVTEIDVTIPSSSEANFIAQGHYYREAFDIIRTHQLEHGDIDTVTIWGLNDGRSWRADQYPLLFNDDLTAKPAFAGTVYNAQFLVPDIWERWERPALPTVIQHAYVFGQSIPMDDSVFAHPAWDALPSHRLTGPAANPGSFEARWTPEALYLLLDVPFGEQTAAVGGGRNLGTRAQIVFEDTDIMVWHDGLAEDVDGVEVITYDAGSSFRAVVRFELDGVSLGDTASLDLFTFNGPDTPYQGGVQASNSERGAWTTRGARGQLTFDQPLAFVQIPAAASAPVLGDFGADVWDNAATLATNVHQGGSADGARAQARAVWYEGAVYSTLFMAIDVDDTTPDVTGANSHEQDSVEIFLGLGDRAVDGERSPLYDAQFRVSRAGVHSFGHGSPAHDPHRITSYVVDNGAEGYQVMVAITLRTGTGHQVGQWNNNPLNDVRVQAFDLQVNDAVDGARASVFAWANHTNLGHSITTHWGAMQLVDELPYVPGDDVPGDEPGDQEPGDEDPIDEDPIDGDEPGDDEPGDELPPYPVWTANRVFTDGDRVVFNGRTFQAQWWTQGEVPGSSPWGSWREIEVVKVGGEWIDVWTPSRVFTNEVVYYRGQLFQAQWWTRNQHPTTQWGPWLHLGPAA